MRWCTAAILIFLALAAAAAAVAVAAANATLSRKSRCNPYAGNWVVDRSYPLYDSSACPFISAEYDCLRFGRPDRDYLSYRWQPTSCDLPRFNGKALLEKWRGKRVMLVGDSLSQDQYFSLLCLLHAADPRGGATAAREGNLFTTRFQAYNLTVLYYVSHFLVDIVASPSGRILKLDAVEAGGLRWLGNDVLIFNTWHWFPYRGSNQQWDYIQDGAVVRKDMDRTQAFSKALKTWSHWVDTAVGGTARVFYLGVSPAHYHGSDWGQADSKTCMGETRPASPAEFRGGAMPQEAMVKDVLAGMRTPVTYLDVTYLSQLRKDGHPSKYNGVGFGDDCTHWCVAGVPDTWNVLLYAAVGAAGE